MAERERRLRLMYLEGAEESSRERLGRGLTEDELERVLRRLRSSTWNGPIQESDGAVAL
jgi:hypothetical protein